MANYYAYTDVVPSFGALRSCPELGLAHVPVGDEQDGSIDQVILQVQSVKFDVLCTVVKSVQDRFDAISAGLSAAEAAVVADGKEKEVTWDDIDGIIKSVEYILPSKVNAHTCSESFRAIEFELSTGLPLDRLHLLDLGLCKVCTYPCVCVRRACVYVWCVYVCMYVCVCVCVCVLTCM